MDALLSFLMSLIIFGWPLVLMWLSDRKDYEKMTPLEKEIWRNGL